MYDDCYGVVGVWGNDGSGLKYYVVEHQSIKLFKARFPNNKCRTYFTFHKNELEHLIKGLNNPIRFVCGRELEKGE